MNKPEFILTVPATEYHQATKDGKYLSSHRMAKFRRDPLEYRQICDGVIVEGDTAAFAKGRAAHVLILEGRERFDEEFVVADGPVNPKTGKPFGKQTKEYAKWQETLGKPAVSTAEFAEFEAMRASVLANPVIGPLLSAGFAEGVVRTDFDGVPVQTRMDWFDTERSLLVDLKTCADLDRARFDIRDYGYVEQLAFYAHALARAGWTRPVDCRLAFVETKPPYRSHSVRISASTLDDAIHGHFVAENVRDDLDEMVRQYKECVHTGVWPTRYEHETVI